MVAPSRLEHVLKRDRAIAITGLAVVAAAAWAYVLAGAGMGMSAFEMTSLAGAEAETKAGVMAGAMSAMTMPAAWTAGYALLMFIMWWVMMVAMMVPSAAPMILLFAAANRRRREKQEPFAPTAVFAGGYLVAWGAFSVAAVILQWGFERTELLSPMMASRNAVFGAVVLLLAGLYQLSPFKHACLRHCRGPMDFLVRHWQPGRWGAFRMGMYHGLYCLGCCWALMALLFFGGVMNLFWIGGLALFVLLEKTVPPGHRLASASGFGFIAWGMLLLLSAV